jgi:enoyl-CoA hydratase
VANQVSSRTEDGICTVTIDNPPVNAFHPEIGERLLETFDRIAHDSPRVVILTSRGKYFMAGGDIRHFKTLNEISAARYARRIQIVQEVIHHFPCPVIAAINGSALGGGCELIMACDIRIAADTALFGQPEVTLGIIPGAGGTQNLPRLIPIGTAKRLLFTGDRITAAEALRLGLIDMVVPAEAVVAEVGRVAERIAANAPLAVAAAKKAVNLGLELGLSEALGLETRLFADLFRSSDIKEGVDAFLSKRPPSYRGK